MDLRQLSLQPNTSYWLSENLVDIFAVRRSYLSAIPNIGIFWRPLPKIDIS